LRGARFLKSRNPKAIIEVVDGSTGQKSVMLEDGPFDETPAPDDRRLYAGANTALSDPDSAFRIRAKAFLPSFAATAALL
jgi:hypothetical protein